VSDSDAVVDMRRWPPFLEYSAGRLCESATFVVGEFVSVRLALASRVKGRVVERVSGEFAMMKVGSFVILRTFGRIYLRR